MIFIVGYSRSGTKMMNEILEKAKISDVVPELHFFGQLYDFDFKKKNTGKENKELVDDMTTILSREGKELKNGIKVQDIQNNMYDYISDNEKSSIDIYRKFVQIINTKNPIDPTPRNAYHISEIANAIQDSKFIYMVRDPRDCILSQSVKWRTYWYKKEQPLEALRLKLNYNPSLMSLFWKNSLNGLSIAKGNGLKDQIFLARYEDVTNNPQGLLKKIKKFLNFEDDFEPDLSFIRSGNIQKWKKGFSKSELYLIEYFIKDELDELRYKRTKFPFNQKLYAVFKELCYLLKFPFVVIMNFQRVKNPWKVFKKRLLGS